MMVDVTRWPAAFGRRVGWSRPPARTAWVGLVPSLLFALAAGAQEESIPNSAPGSPSSSAALGARVYIWWDGDRPVEVFREPNMVVVREGGPEPLGETVGRMGADVLVRVTEAGANEGPPVFRSVSGALMTLPGGVVLVLDSSWDEARTAFFLRSHGIAADRVSSLGAVPNGFVVATDPGFAALDLANDLAGRPGVRVSSPDWSVERPSR